MTVRGAAARASVRAAIQATADDLGQVTPTGVIAAAEDPSNILHSEFEWDNSVAGHQHRLAQARMLIREITFEASDVKRRPISEISYVHRPGAKQQCYVPLSRVKRSRKLAKAVLDEEISRCESSIRRAREIADVIGLRDDLDVILRELVVIKRRAAAA